MVPSYETPRRILIRSGLHTPKAKRKVCWRRMLKAGLLGPMGTSMLHSILRNHKEPKGKYAGCTERIEVSSWPCTLTEPHTLSPLPIVASTVTLPWSREIPESRYPPQARGRIERLFRLLQDRPIKERRLGGIKDYESANRSLQEEFLSWHNTPYTLPAESAHQNSPRITELELFSLQEMHGKPKRTIP